MAEVALKVKTRSRVPEGLRLHVPVSRISGDGVVLVAVGGVASSAICCHCLAQGIGKQESEAGEEIFHTGDSQDVFSKVSPK